jgi:hypothetical protein
VAKQSSAKRNKAKPSLKEKGLILISPFFMSVILFISIDTG